MTAREELAEPSLTVPALRTARDRVLELLADGAGADQLQAMFEASPGLALALLRRANRNVPAASVRAALGALSGGALVELVQNAAVYDPLKPARGGVAASLPRFRAHALAVRRATSRLAEAIPVANPEVLVAASLIHDVGKLALEERDDRYARAIQADAGTPEERLAAERAALGTDHTRVGASLAAAWGLPSELIVAIGEHHEREADGLAGLVRLSDALAHFAHGDTIDIEELTATSRRFGMSAESLGSVMYDLPVVVTARACPLSERELEILSRLREGKVYKEIGFELGISPNTVRSHLHRIYKRIGVSDRAQAVLAAAEHGWI